MNSELADLSKASKQQQPSLLVRLFPILFFEAYFLCSLLGFLFSPVVQFQVNNPLPMVLYALLGQGIILLGYVWGVRRPPCGYSGAFTSRFLSRTAIIVSLLVFVGALVFRDDNAVSFEDALADPSTAYLNRVNDIAQRTQVSTFSLIRGFLGPILGLLIPLGIVYGKHLSKGWKILWGLGLVFVVVDGLLTGAAKGLFDVVLIVPWFLWIKARHAPAPLPGAAPAQRSILKRALLVVGALIVGFLAIQYFGESRQARYGLTGEDYPAGMTGWSRAEWGIELPPSTEYTTYMILAYWTGGYCGLAESLELPFEWSYGCGHSFVLMRYVGQFSNNPDFVYERCYPIRVEASTGYSAEQYWHTIYPWLASDLTFAGALLFMGGMAYLFARAWTDSLRGANPFALAFLAQVLLMFYYVPCSNVRLGFSEEIISFWCLLVLWLSTRKTENPAATDKELR